MAEKEKVKEVAEEKVTKVAIVPDDGLTDEQKEAQKESQTPEATENRNASYSLPVENVNQNQ